MQFLKAFYIPKRIEDDDVSKHVKLVESRLRGGNVNAQKGNIIYPSDIEKMRKFILS